LVVRRLIHILFAAGAFVLVGATVPSADDFSPGPLTRAEANARSAALADLGRQMFFDPNLSASGRMSCATCHDPARAFGPPDAMPVQIGGPLMDLPGIRAAPSLRYLHATPQFSEHFFDSDDEGDESVDNGPTGGLMWDGRADRARFPLLSPFEMANTDPAAVAAKLKSASYASDVRAIFGAAVFDNSVAAFDAALEALAAFEESPADFYPYSSKYDAYLADKATLSVQEVRGLRLFEAEDKGNCASCHISEPANNGEPPKFTDFGLIALGVPRNPAIPVNTDPKYFDLGLCGPLRTDFALRQTFFHNGEFHTLRDAVAFYPPATPTPAAGIRRKSPASCGNTTICRGPIRPI
jgi:cytochrome c peroxidase